jgi:hypothetical protein
MPAGRRPSRPHPAASWARRARVCVAHGPPWSGRRRVGQPQAWTRPTNPGWASCPRGDESAGPPSRTRLTPSATVRGEPYRPAAVVNGPRTAAVPTAVGAALRVVGCPGGPRCRRGRGGGTRPWRRTRSHPVARAGQGQGAGRFPRRASRVWAPQAGGRGRASRRARTIASGVCVGRLPGVRERSSRPWGPSRRARSIP